MAISSDFCMGQYSDDHQEDALHFITENEVGGLGSQGRGHRVGVTGLRSQGRGHRVGVTYKPKMRNIIIWNIGKIFVPLFSPFWTWIHIRSKKFFNKGQGFFVIVRMNKQIYHCILCISLFMVTIIAPYVQIRPKGRFWMLRVVKFVNQSL